MKNLPIAAAMRDLAAPGNWRDATAVALIDGTQVPCRVIGRDISGPGVVVDTPAWSTAASVLPEQLRA